MDGGFIANPLALTVFLALVMTVTAYLLLERFGLAGRLGYWESLAPFGIIVLLSAGIFAILRAMRKQYYEIGIPDPIFARRLMTECLEQTCGLLEKRLSAKPAISRDMLFYEMIQHKMFDIYDKDCLRFYDIRKRVAQCGLKRAPGLDFAAYFQSAEAFVRTPLPQEMQLFEDVVRMERRELKKLQKRVAATRKTLFTIFSDYLDLLPPNPKKVDGLRKQYRYRPPAKDQAVRMAFALETLDYLMAIRFDNVKPYAQKKYVAAAKKAMPRLTDAYEDHKSAWMELVLAYERDPAAALPEAAAKNV